MNGILDDLSYRTLWNDIHFDFYSGFKPNMTGYHTHSYYEISFILEGNVSVLLPNQSDVGEELRLVLTPPFTPHYIFPDSRKLYSRENLSFSTDFLSDPMPEWRSLIGVFGKSGRLIHLSEDSASRLKVRMESLKTETDPFRARLQLLCLLSVIRDELPSESHGQPLPPYVAQALDILSTRYSEKLTAAGIADELHIGRTTLLTGFKKYTGSTLLQALTRRRLRSALALLQNGTSEQAAAEACGFGEASNFVRTARRVLGESPKKYISTHNT